MTNEESLKQLVKTYYKGICTFSEATNRALELGCSEEQWTRMLTEYSVKTKPIPHQSPAAQLRTIVEDIARPFEIVDAVVHIVLGGPTIVEIRTTADAVAVFVEDRQDGKFIQMIVP